MLYRAIVSLPESLCERSRLTQERFVFFEGPLQDKAMSAHIERLLATVWNVDTSLWVERGFIYNVYSERELKRQAASEVDSDYELQLFECGAGGSTGIGRNRVHFARQLDCDFFVSPTLASQLLRTSNYIESLYAKAPRTIVGNNNVIGDGNVFFGGR